MANETPVQPPAQNRRARGFFPPRRENPKLGIWVFLGGEAIFFTSLILTYVVFRLDAPQQYLQFKQHLSVPLVGVNTFILITSSFMVVRALDAIIDGKKGRFTGSLIAVIVLGALFIGGQAFEWTTLFGEGISISDQFGTPFFTITGIHGTHVFIGLVWATILLSIGLNKDFTPLYQRRFEIFGLYWHFVDIVWIVLFTLFYLI